MTVLRKTARRHGMSCLLHEKPFDCINGSGKHLNYSIGSPEVGNLFAPGDNPHENAQFLVFLCSVIRALHRHAGFLRASVSSASNDRRLGGHEAPPAIMSLFLGDQLTDVLEQFRVGHVTGSAGKRLMNVGVDTLPPLPADPGDRNRTSPFAFVALACHADNVEFNGDLTRVGDELYRFAGTAFGTDASCVGNGIEPDLILGETIELNAAVYLFGTEYTVVKSVNILYIHFICPCSYCNSSRSLY